MAAISTESAISEINFEKNEVIEESEECLKSWNEKRSLLRSETSSGSSVRISKQKCLVEHCLTS